MNPRFTTHLIVAAGLAGLAFASGCDSGYAMAPLDANLAHAGLINDPAQVSRLEKSLTNDDFSRMLDADVRAKLPSPIAIARFNRGCGNLDTVSAEELEAWGKTIEKESMLTGFLPINRLLLPEQRLDMKDLRAAAARMNCELLLVYIQDDGWSNNDNAASVLYWTIVGLWTVPGSTQEHRTVMQGVLVDTRTGMVLGAFTGDKSKKVDYPAAFHDATRADLERQVAPAALSDLQKGFKSLIAQVVANAKAAQARS